MYIGFLKDFSFKREAFRGVSMSRNIYINLVAHKLVYSGDFPERNEIVKEWYFQSNSVEKSNLEKLFLDATKGRDWRSYDIETTPNNIKFSIVLTFFVNSIEDKLSNDDENILNTIIEQVNLFVAINRGKNTALIDNSDDIDEESLVYVCHNSDSVELKQFLEQLKANNIKFHIEYEHIQVSDQGAMGSAHDIIIFIHGAVVSGLTYDLIKKVPLLIYTGFKKKQIDTIKEIIARCLSTNPKNIEIIQLQKDNKTIKLMVNYNNNKYIFELDDENNVIYFKKIN